MDFAFVLGTLCGILLVIVVVRVKIYIHTDE